MRKLLTIALAALFALAGCSKGGDEEERQIVLPDESEQTQTAWADEETAQGFTFTAKSAWTATVKETTATRASGVEWLQLTNGGEETYSGGAGEFTLAVELDPNYTGAARSAVISVASGVTVVNITVSQDGKTKTGVAPPKPDANYFGTWIIMGSKDNAVYWENATIGEKSIVYRSADGDVYTLENLKWTAVKMPEDDTNGDGVIDGNDDTGYLTGYKITGKLTANPGGRKIARAEGTGYASVGEMAADWWYISAEKDALVHFMYAEPVPGTHHTEGSGPYLEQVGTNPEKPENNKFTINGRSVDIVGGEMHYYGDEYSKTAENVFVGLFPAEYPDDWDEVDLEADFWVALDMLVPDGKDRLAAGTYTFANSHAPFTFTSDREASGAVDEVNAKWRQMNGGTVKVSVSGTGAAAVYTIAVDCTLTGGGTVKGTYRSILPWSDERE